MRPTGTFKRKVRLRRGGGAEANGSIRQLVKRLSRNGTYFTCYGQSVSARAGRTLVRVNRKWQGLLILTRANNICLPQQTHNTRTRRPLRHHRALPPLHQLQDFTCHSPDDPAIALKMSSSTSAEKPKQPKLNVEEYLTTAISATPQELHPFFESFQTLHSRKCVTYPNKLPQKYMPDLHNHVFFVAGYGISSRASSPSSSIIRSRSLTG